MGSTLITKRRVDALAPGAFLWDRGFGVKATAGGDKIYLLNYHFGGRKRRYTIGAHGAPWTPDTARKEALRLQHRVAAGVDPMAEKALGRTAPRVRDVVARFLDEYVVAKRAAGTARLYRGILEQHVLPAWGPRPIASITRSDVLALHHRLRATPVHANRTLLLISKLMNLASAWGLRPEGTNPAQHVERYREHARQRYLTRDEFRRLGQALRAADRGPVPLPGGRDPVRLPLYALAAIKLLLFTGARRGEMLALRWDDLDLDRHVANLPTSKTGFKVVHLNAPALAVLAGLPRIVGNPYVLPGQRRGQHLVNVTDTWYAIRALADLPDVRLHDLRHSLASVGAGAGLSLSIIGGLLGHSQPGTTARYAHLAADPLQKAAELVGEHIADALGAR
jgi:integrase